MTMPVADPPADAREHAPVGELSADPATAEAAASGRARTATAGRTAATGWAVDRNWQWRRWRIPVALIAAIVVAGVALAHLQQRHMRTNVYLDPADSSAIGSQALADLLGERGIRVIAAYSPADALTPIGPAGGGSASPISATLIITAPDLLSRRELATLSRVRADLILVEPGSAALRALAPAVSVETSNGLAAGPVQPGCSLPAARLAGSADLGGITYGTSSGKATGCYLVNGFPALVRYASAGRTITILGSGVPLTNAFLADNGNAALALNLLSAHDQIVWLTPQPATAATAPRAGTRPPQGPTLIPWAAWLVVFQLLAAVLLAMLWRGRRFGPLIAERLPVVVRASETVEGHARLYQSRRVRGRAAQALREAMLARTLPALGLPKGADADAVSQALASRSRLAGQDVTALVYGPAPATDGELMTLLRQLDDLEREVLSR